MTAEQCCSSVINCGNVLQRPLDPVVSWVLGGALVCVCLGAGVLFFAMARVVWRDLQ